MGVEAIGQDGAGVGSGVAGEIGADVVQGLGDEDVEPVQGFGAVAGELVVGFCEDGGDVGEEGGGGCLWSWLLLLLVVMAVKTSSACGVAFVG